MQTAKMKQLKVSYRSKEENPAAARKPIKVGVFCDYWNTMVDLSYNSLSIASLNLRSAIDCLCLDRLGQSRTSSDPTAAQKAKF